MVFAMNQVLVLQEEWRNEAATLRKRGDVRGAELLLGVADELRRRLSIAGDETLTLVEAAAISGYHPAHVGRLVRTGKLANYGRRHAPRVRRADLPLKRRLLTVDGGMDHDVQVSREQIARSIVNRR
jgi:hypothetical protein